MLTIIMTAWVLVGVWAYGQTVGDFTAHYPTQRPPMVLAIICGVFGPVGLFVVLLTSDYQFHFRLKPLTKQKRWEAFQRRYSGLSYEDFEDFEEL